MSRPLWRELLDTPTQAFDDESAGLAVIAAGGHAAHQYATRRWLGIRADNGLDAQTALAVILAEAFGDARALSHLASQSPEPYPDQMSRFDKQLGPESHVARIFGERILEGLRAYLERDGDLPFELLAAAARYQLDDRGEIYLRLRVAAAERTVATPFATLGAAFADRALEAAAVATPNRAEVQRTVLSHWGMDFCADEIPFEDSRAGFAPTRWIATCSLIERVNRSRVADRLIELAYHDDYWRTPSRDSIVFIHSLRESCGATAAATLDAIARAKSSNSPAALLALRERADMVRAASSVIRDRIRRVAAALSQIDTVHASLDEPVLKTLTEQFVFQEDSSVSCITTEVLIATQTAVSIKLLGEFEPPVAEVVAGCTHLHGGGVGFDSAFLEPSSDQNEWVLRFLRDGLPHTRTLTTSGNELSLTLLDSLLQEVSEYVGGKRRFAVLDSDYADATIGYLEAQAWRQLAEIRAESAAG